ncbi:MAG: hypothetical protein HFF84_03345 [Oscillibacter sp.]|nr:hypothetical protein [Oscillibacter sp.]
MPLQNGVPVFHLSIKPETSVSFAPQYMQLLVDKVPPAAFLLFLAEYPTIKAIQGK